uniref:thymidine kinase n=1 Tax=viral metagenome TaxID=1070528 RepID=A0A6C0AF50_9ZZZZ
MSNKTGSLTVYTGSMASGKTSYLINDITMWLDINTTEDNIIKKPLIINSKKDNRDILNIISSNSSNYKGINNNIDTISTNTLIDIDVSNRDVLGIDECNLFSDLEPAVKLWLSKGKNIYVAGLCTDFKGNKFGNISDILYLSDKFVKLTAKCSLCLSTCTNLNELPSAPFTAKLNSSKEQIEIGNTKTLYKAVCRKHLNECLKKYGHV